MNGIFLLNKKENISSFNFIKNFKKINNFQKIGHTGTLDPFATGLLVSPINEGLKFLQFLENKEKVYIFEATFGKQTNTGDYTGEVIKTSDNVIFSKEEIKNVLKEFIGKIEQIPNKFSAIKINGKKAYNLIRENIDFQMPKRIVEIKKLEFISYIDNKLSVKATTSPGTYIRTLAEDIAKKLNSVSYLTKLHRTSSNGFNLNIDEEFIELEYFNTILPTLCCSDNEIKKLKSGVKLTINKPNGLYAVNNNKMNFFGILLINNSTTFVKRMLL